MNLKTVVLFCLLSNFNFYLMSVTIDSLTYKMMDGVLDETVKVPIAMLDKKAASEKFNAEISFLFADLKYRQGSLKVCEFGGANGAGPHEQLTELQFYKKSLYMNAPYWPFLWLYLSKLNKPVWYLGQDPNIFKEKYDRFSADIIHWDLYLKLNGNYVESIEALENNIMFKRAIKSNLNFQADDLGTYRGIIILRNTHKKNRELAAEITKKYPWMLIVGKETSKYTISKIAGSRLFRGRLLKQYKPRWGKYPVEYDSTLAAKIMSDVAADMFVIKPTNSMRGRGIVLASAKNLDAILREMFVNTGAGKLSESECPVTFGYWKAPSSRSTFMVEEFCPSKTITVRGRFYDPTMRLFFIVRQSKGCVYVTVLGGYWKIPEKPLNDKQATLTQRHITIAGFDDWLTGITIDKNDLYDVRKILKNILPEVYLNMLKDNK